MRTMWEVALKMERSEFVDGSWREGGENAR